MKKLLTIILSAVLVLMMCAPAFAAEDEAANDADPIVGSWKLLIVYANQKDQPPVILKEEEAQSVYGSGIGIYTFDGDGFAHYVMFDVGDMVDLAGEWKSTGKDTYVYTEEDTPGETTFTYEKRNNAESLKRNFKDDNPDAVYQDLTFVYSRAFVDSWKLDRVLEIHEGDAPVELPKEENQSLYGSGESILTILADGTGKSTVTEAGDSFETAGTWVMPEPDKIIYTEDSMELDMEYSRVYDTLTRVFKDESPDAAHALLHFIYVRAE